MRRIAVVTIAAATLLGSLASASAQDEEEQGEGDIDSLMATDPEKEEAKPEDKAEEEAEAPPGDEDGESAGMTDDERPPGEESSADAEPQEAAAEPEDSSGPSKPISIGLLVGYGHALGTGANPWSAGFGLRGGYNIGGFYLGGRFTYYVGETVTVLVPSFAGETREEDLTANLWELGAEAGYDIRADNVVVRPEFGVGFASVSGNQTETVGYVAPGLALLLDVSAGFFLGIDARYQYVATEQGKSGLGFFANIGMRF